MRSLLFVPGDSERKIAKALASNADALILDLEDSVAPDRKETARRLCAEALASVATTKRLFVRINPLDTPEGLPDLAAVVRGRPFGIMLPKCRDGADLRLIEAYLDALEAREGYPAGSTMVLPIVTETGSAMFRLGSYEGSSRLAGMLWGAEDLAADVGAAGNRGFDTHYAPTYELARTLCLLAATATKTIAVDAVFTDFRDMAGLRAEAEIAAHDGFTAKAAIHPDQADIINAAFTPSPVQVEHARRVVAAFEATAGAGVAALDGRMLDRPHHRAALRVLARSTTGES